RLTAPQAERPPEGRLGTARPLPRQRHARHLQPRAARPAAGGGSEDRRRPPRGARARDREGREPSENGRNSVLGGAEWLQIPPFPTHCRKTIVAIAGISGS